MAEAKKTHLKIPPFIWAIVAVGLLSGGLWSLWSQYKDFLQQGQKPPEEAVLLNQLEKSGMPNLQFKTIENKEFSLKDLQGKLVILNFWASWCNPCVAEFPSLLKLIAHYKDQIVLVAVSGDYQESDIFDFLKVFKVNDPNMYVVWDKELTAAKQLGTFRLPESYIIGKDGRLIRKVSGVDDWASADAFEYFAHLLGQRK